MAGEQANVSRRDVEARLIGKAARDAAFREEVLRDPKATDERELSVLAGNSVQLPAHVKVVVHEEAADMFHLVLPPVSPVSAGEISDAELGGVAGGTGGIPVNASQMEP